MNEQIMKILPVELPYENIRENEDLELHFALGYNCSIKDCASAIEKANLVRCPTEEEIEIVMHNAYFKHKELIKSTDAGMLKEYAKAIFALLRGEK